MQVTTDLPLDHQAIQKLPLYLISYVLHFTEKEKLWMCALVCKKFQEAVYQLQLLRNGGQCIDRAETINKYLLPMFDKMDDLSHEKLSMSVVVHHCLQAVFQETGVSRDYDNETKVGNIVWQNCMRFKVRHNTNWFVELSRNQQLADKYDESDDEITISDDDYDFPDDEEEYEDHEDNEIDLDDYDFIDDDEPRFKRHCRYWRHAGRKRKISQNDFADMAHYIK